MSDPLTLLNLPDFSYGAAGDAGPFPEPGESFTVFFPAREAESGEDEWVSDEELRAGLDEGRRISQEETPGIEERARAIFDEAYVEGEKVGIEMGMKKLEPVLKRLEQGVAQFDDLVRDMWKKAEDVAVSLAVSLAEGIVLKECEEHREVIADMARKAMDLCHEKTQVIIRVRKDDARYLSGMESSTLRIVPDDSMRTPGFIIETEFGEVDGMISTQMAEIRNEYVGRYRE
jgi:flagellar biosynthesis/type III secretory pathway protein FliH